MSGVRAGWPAAAAAVFGLASLASQISFGSPMCVTGPEQLPAVDLLALFIKHRGSIDLERSSGCLQVSDPPIGVAAVRLVLPSFEEPYALRIAAPLDRTVILPRVTFLDEQFRVTRSFGAEALKRRGTELSFEVFINPADANERYVVLYADPAHIGESDQRTVSRTTSVFVGSGVIYLGSELGSHVVAVDTGNMVVSLIGERYQKLRHGR
jgi:Maltose operon periplasmic protein precursor (MalM)